MDIRLNRRHNRRNTDTIALNRDTVEGMVRYGIA